MKILHLSTRDFQGGAARAAYRIHRAQLNAGMDSSMLVRDKETDDERVVAIAGISRTTWIKGELLRHWYKRLSRNWRPALVGYHNFGWCSAGLVPGLNASNADIFNLHWISDILSVQDIGSLRKPVIWTMHDMWPLCGGEHYVPDEPLARFRQGYFADNRFVAEDGPDLNRKTWEAKRRCWAVEKFNFVCPSKWLADCVKGSRLFGGANVVVIPNPIDTGVMWKPVDRGASRLLLELPQDKKLVLFGAEGGVSDPRKGGDLLRRAIVRVCERMPGEVELVVFGQSRGNPDDVWPCPVHWLGAVRDDRLLVQAYSAADVMVVPSRQDNLPNTVLESQACGTPVVAFDVGGLPEAILHRKTGWLAHKEDEDGLAEGICWVLADNPQGVGLRQGARNYAVTTFSEEVVASKYRQFYELVLER